MIVVVVAAVVVVGGGDDDGSKSASTSSDAAAPAQSAPEQGTASPEAAAKLNRIIAKVQRRALAEAPAVAGPVITQARDTGRISAREARSLRRAARSLARGKGLAQLAGTVDISDPGVAAVVRKSLAELKPRAQQLAKPILARALAKGEITEAQAADVRAFVDAGGGYTVP